MYKTFSDFVKEHKEIKEIVRFDEKIDIVVIYNNECKLTYTPFLGQCWKFISFYNDPEIINGYLKNGNVLILDDKYEDFTKLSLYYFIEKINVSN